MIYKGSCHCGKIVFEAEGNIEGVVECNCSICRRRGHLLWFVSRDQLKFSTPESAISTYLFHKKIIKHHFCPTCGCGPFGTGTDPKGKSMAAINVRCLDNVNIPSLKIIPFDGKSI